MFARARQPMDGAGGNHVPQGGGVQQKRPPDRRRKVRARLNPKLGLGGGCKGGGGIGGLGHHGWSSVGTGGVGSVCGVQRGRHRSSKPSTILSETGALSVLEGGRAGKRVSGWGCGQLRDGGCGSQRWTEPRGGEGRRG